MRFQKALCTSGSGRIGSYVTEDLRGRCALTVLDVNPSHAPGVQYVKVNITGLAALKKAFQGQDITLMGARLRLSGRTPAPDLQWKNRSRHFEREASPVPKEQNTFFCVPQACRLRRRHAGCTPSPQEIS